MTTEELENYTPKGELQGFPKEIIARMLDYQEEQGNKRNVTVFEKWIEASRFNDGFAWDKTKEDREFWDDVIRFKNFNRFFEKYPKQDYQESKTAKYVQVGNNAILSDITSTQSSVEIEINTTEDNSQEFRVGDNVIDIITRQKGKIFRIDTNNKSIFIVYVNFNEEKNIYTLDGRLYFNDKYPRLLHYRDDYDYDVIDFNNLPERQEPNKRWRAEVWEKYYSFTSNFEVEDYLENNDCFDDEAYDSGNYFRTEIEAEIIAQKLNTYFKQLITKLI